MSPSIFVLTVCSNVSTPSVTAISPTVLLSRRDKISWLQKLHFDNCFCSFSFPPPFPAPSRTAPPSPSLGLPSLHDCSKSYFVLFIYQSLLLFSKVGTSSEVMPRHCMNYMKESLNEAFLTMKIFSMVAWKYKFCYYWHFYWNTFTRLR